MGYKVGSALVITLMSRPFDPSATLPITYLNDFFEGRVFRRQSIVCQIFMSYLIK